jgi:hypothetical protein
MVYLILFYLSLTVRSNPTRLNIFYPKFHSGKWSSSSKFLSFSERSGRLKYQVRSEPYLEDSLRIEIEIKNGPWNDDESEKLIIYNASYKEPESFIMINNSYSLFKGEGGTRCQINGEIAFKTHKSEGFLRSLDCDFNLTLKTNNKENIYENPRAVYSFGLFCVCFVQSFIVTKYQEMCILSESIAMKTSFLSWLINSSIDLSVVTFNVLEIIRETVSLESMIMGMTWSIASFYTVRSKLLFIIFRSHHSDLPLQVCYAKFSRLTLIFCKVYLDFLVVVANLVAYQFKSLYLLLIPLMLSLYVPQIVLTAVENLKTPLVPFIACAISFSRMILLVKAI